MKIGDSQNRVLDARQSRVIILMVLVIVALAGLSTYTHFTYRDVKAMVVGNTINLASRADGRIARLLVRENEAFPAGTPLVELSNPSLRAQLESMEREVDEVRRSLNAELSGIGLDRRVYELETTFSEVKTKLAAARTELEGIDSIVDNLELAREQSGERLHSAEKLFAVGAMTRGELEQRRRQALDAGRECQEALNRRKVLVSEVATLEKLLALHERRMNQLGADRGRIISDLEITLAEKEGELARLRSVADELTIVAEHNGIVSSVLKKSGEYVPAGEPILTVMTADDLWVEAYLPPDEKRSVQPGDRVFIHGSTGGDRLAGRVESILPVLRPFPGAQSTLGNGNGNYAVVVIGFDDSDEASALLSPAQRVQAKIRRRWMPVATAGSESESNAKDVVDSPPGPPSRESGD